ncbi:MAG TPA: DUF4388 domain-containing protein [Vicinamibacteria bacterium]|nr:DUF4388 domain-containing protein [Vicinamibacteria bacterium]
MALEGTIRDFGLPDIFQLIGLQRKTGLLTLTNEKDDESVTVTFENGMVVMADSSARRLEDRLGNVLVKQGKITGARLEEALAVQKQTLQRLGHILASGSAITTKDLRDALSVQISQIVFRVFRWRDGRYHFAPAETVDYDRENFVPMSTDFILMEGIRMVDEWPIIEKRIPSFDIVFRPVVDPSLIEVGAGSAPDTSISERRVAASATGRIRLAPEEERVFRKVDGVRTVQAIIDGTGAGEFEVCRTLFDFLNRNLIAAAGHGSAPSLEDAETASVASAVPGYVVAVLVVSLALAGLLVQRRSPFAVTGLPPVLHNSYEAVLDGSTRSRLARLARAVEAWRATHGAPPAALEELVRAGLVDRSYLHDPWSRPFHYETGAGGYLLSAVDESGASRKDATLDRRGGR